MVSVEEEHLRVAERIQAIARQCRSGYNAYPESLTSAICQYVAGEGELAQVQQELSRVGGNSYYHFWQCIVISDPHTEHLDEMDLRVLDICIATNSIGGFFSKIAAAGPVEQALDYLRAKSIDESTIIDALTSNSEFYNNTNSITALGRLILSHLPERFDEFLKGFPSRRPGSYNNSLFRLLMIAQPEGYLDRAWQLANVASRGEKDEYAAALLKADPARFTDWARQVARDTIQHQQLYHYYTLEALLELDSAQHIDLALEAAQAPILRPSVTSSATLQQIGIKAAYRFDPVKYLSVVEEAAITPDGPSRSFATSLLKETAFEQAQPTLQRIVSSGEFDVASSALDALLEHEWPERQDYLISLLPHRSSLIRETSVAELAKGGESLIEALAPSLAHKSVDARLAAVHALRRIGGERAKAVLVARLDAEKSPKIKQAILDVVGGAAVIALDEAGAASPAEALVAEAEAVHKQLKKPALPWFDAAQMPGLRWTDGEPVPQVVVNYLLYLQSRVKEMEPAERIQQALPLIDRGSSGDLALALFNGWARRGAPSKQAWILPLMCALADERLIHPLRQAIDDWAGGTRSVIAGRAVTAMVSIEGNPALEEINDLTEHGKSFEVIWAARRALEAIAKQRGITLDDVYDLAVPKLGFDEHGLRVFDYGPRQFTLRLHFDQTIQITDTAGKRFMKLPHPGKRDDERKAKAALAAWNMLRKRVPQVVKSQAERLESALKVRRSWDIARWQALFLKHPIMRSLAITLVWGVVSGESSEYQAIFRPLEDGSLTDVEDNAVELPAEGQIRIVHPAELHEETRNAWLQHLTDYEVLPLFTQLNQPVVQVQPEERDALANIERIGNNR